MMRGGAPKGPPQRPRGVWGECGGGECGNEQGNEATMTVIAASTRASRPKGLSEAHTSAVAQTPGLPKELNRMA